MSRFAKAPRGAVIDLISLCINLYYNWLWQSPATPASEIHPIVLHLTVQQEVGVLNAVCLIGSKYLEDVNLRKSGILKRYLIWCRRS